MEQQKQPVAPDTKTAAGTPPPQQKGNGQDQGNKQAPPAGNQPPAPKQATPPASEPIKAS